MNTNAAYVISWLRLSLISLLLSACLHHPTESVVKNSLSSELRTYQDLDNIFYTVRANASLIEEDPSVAGTMLIAIQLVDVNSNLKFMLNGRVVIYDTSSTPNRYIYEDGNGTDGPADNELGGLKPLLNCRNIENNIGEPCIEDVFLVGSLILEWKKVNDITEPVSNTAIPVLQETWSLELTESDENFIVTGTTPRIKNVTTRYISQSTDALTQGELFVHAYATKPASAALDWVAVADADQNPVIAKATSDPSPISGSGITENIQFDVYTGCDAAVSISSCVAVAHSEKNMTYQENSERLALDNYGAFSVQIITLSGRVDRASTATGAVNLGYDTYTNCSPDIQNATFKRKSVTYTGIEAMYPDLGPLRLNFSCNAVYEVSYGAPLKTYPVGTSVHIDAKLVNTNIDF